MNVRHLGLGDILHGRRDVLLPRILEAAAGFGVAALALIGLVKAQQLRALVPVDLTLLVVAICAVLCLIAVGVRRSLPREVWWVAVFVGTLLPGLVWSSDPANTYASTKSHELLTFVPACLLAPVLLLVTIRSQKWFLGVVVATSVIPSYVVLTQRIDPIYGRATVSDLNPIGVGRVLAAAAVVCAIYALRESLLRFRLVCAAGAVVLLYGAWRTGSRGPLLSAFLAVAFVVLAGLVVRASRRLLLVCAMGGALVVVAVVVLGIRDGALVHRDTGESNSERFALYGRSFHLLLTHPGGIGWGNLIDHLEPGQIITNQGWAQYSHNMLLEVGVEGGWIALASLLALIVLTFRRLFLRRHSTVGAALLALWIFGLATAMTSSDFTSNRLTLVMFGVGLVQPVCVEWMARDRGRTNAVDILGAHDREPTAEAPKEDPAKLG